ncbi:hypothetical protein ACH4SP_06710 [Streptomyces sp. NPDC021093]|uniref:hypothetical protein n=1 Tax=Streptomyces sp. NPDC021093 TaxID=3365112 RepID=UPI0037A0F1A9
MNASDTDSARLNALTALGGSTEANRAELIEAAWRSGTRNPAELASAAGIGRDAVYADLTARGIDRQDRDEAPAPRPDVVTADAVHAVARLAEETFGPLVHDTQDPGPLTTVTWQLAIAYRAIAALLLDELPDADREETAEELSDRLQIALHHSHLYRASRSTQRRLGAQTRRTDAEIAFLQPLPTAATVTLTLRSGDTLTATLGSEEATGFTTLSSDSPLLDTTLEAHDHLELHTALDTVAQVLTRHL